MIDRSSSSGRSLGRHLPSRLRINVSWFLKLRWAAVGGQLVTISTVHAWMGIELPLAELLSIVAFAAASNVALWLWFARQVKTGRWERWAARGEIVLGSVMGLDILLLTALLFVAGGPSNPFTVFYLANISLAAVMLSPRWLACLSALAILCYAGLFLEHWPLPALGDVDASSLALFGGLRVGEGDPMRLIVEGNFVAFTAAVSVSIYFMSRVTMELARRERDLRRIRQQQAQSEKLEALATLAAGAAHELASPLSTIAVIAKELEVHLESSDHPEDAVEDSKLIRCEVDRCRNILDQMAAGAGESTGEALVRISAQKLIDDCLEEVHERERVEVAIEGGAAREELFVPPTALARAVRSLIKNALDASPGGAGVRLELRCVDGGLELAVVDRGDGMTPEVLARLGDPFFTTKDPGRGMGLGIFISRTVIQRLGGRLGFESHPGEGTTARMFLPRPADAAS